MIVNRKKREILTAILTVEELKEIWKKTNIEIGSEMDIALELIGSEIK